ncbi:hypothetical protein [uncultured Brevibacillus sp.]|uniref:hypothetical protein n=1 Tax=uncultured Brevibacillus sp. TaxID=169970 RepID=UPI002599CFD8|nr:hypothetical protein [uncultured Brevibacillus sp.]
MQAGRELDAKVAGALKGWEPEFIEHLKENDGWILIPHYSTDWRRMGELVEEAKEKEIYLDYSHSLNGGYYGFAGIFADGEYQIHHNTPTVDKAPYAICLAFLMAKGIEV